MSDNKRCHGCYLNNIDSELCPFTNKDFSSNCPCQTCVIKCICDKPCDPFFEYSKTFDKNKIFDLSFIRSRVWLVYFISEYTLKFEGVK